MDDQVPEEVKRERIERLVDLVQHHARRRNEALVGTVQEVLVEGSSRTDADLGRGRSRGNKTVLFSPPAPEGALVPVRIEAATSQTLRGTAEVAAVA
jgi:tRNA-2-methylthio-N6-dimethylallyladenosine synthase